MVKKIIIRIAIIIAIVLASVSGYYFVIDRESNIPENLDFIIDIKTEHFMGRKVFKLSPKKEILELQNTIKKESPLNHRDPSLCYAPVHKNIFSV